MQQGAWSGRCWWEGASQREAGRWLVCRGQWGQGWSLGGATGSVHKCHTGAELQSQGQGMCKGLGRSCLRNEKVGLVGLTPPAGPE